MRPERLSPATCFLSMETPTQYREFAELCEHLATQTKDEQHKKILMEMAFSWKQLAEKIEGENNR